MLAFSGCEMRAIVVIAMRAKQIIKLKIMQTLRSLNMCSVTRTHRGNTAGINLFCSISTATTFDRNFPKATFSGVTCVNYDNITRAPLVSSPSSDQCESGIEDMGISTFKRGRRAGRNKQQPMRRITGRRPSSALVCRNSLKSTNLASLRISPATSHDAHYSNVSLFESLQ